MTRIVKFHVVFAELTQADAVVDQTLLLELI